MIACWKHSCKLFLSLINSYFFGVESKLEWFSISKLKMYISCPLDTPDYVYIKDLIHNMTDVNDFQDFIS